MGSVATAPPKAVSIALERFVGELSRRFGQSLLDVRLFGSHARGDAHEHSDVDVLVVLEAVDWDIRREIIDLATDAGLELDLLLSPTIFDRQTYERYRRQQRALVVDIEREGLPL